MPYASSNDSIRREIAAVAARHIADGGLDYGTAKRKAARELTGRSQPPGASMPDNDAIDDALAEHLNLFDDGHAQRIARRRSAACALMQWLAHFDPYVTGAVWKGIVAEHAPIHLQLFHDNPKEIEITLLDRRIRFDTTTMPHFRQAGEVQALAFYWHDEPVLVSIYDPIDIRGALRAGPRGAERGNLDALRARSTPPVEPLAP